MDCYSEDRRLADVLLEYFDRYAIDPATYDVNCHFVWFTNWIPLLVPNPPARKRALRRHDLNHVLSGYNALSTEGEIDIAGYEIGARGGCGRYWVAWYINLVFLALGLFLRRPSVMRAFARAADSRNAYSVEDLERFYGLTLGEARHELGVDPGSGAVVTHAVRRKFYFWSAIGVGTLLGSLVAFLLLIYGLLWAFGAF